MVLICFDDFCHDHFFCDIIKNCTKTSSTVTIAVMTSGMMTLATVVVLCDYLQAH